MDSNTIQYYDDHGADIAKRYEAVGSPVSQYFSQAFLPGSTVLEIGTGSGRDLAALHASGLDVLGVEPSKTLRDAATHFHPELVGKLREGALPELHLGKATFDGVLCSAVLMHIAPHLLFDSALQIRNSLKVNGRLLLSLPLARGDTDHTHRDPHSRLFYPYTPDQIETLFTRLGFVLISRWDTDDTLQRTGNSWFTQLYEYRAQTGVRPLDQIEAVLNRDRKEATYKLALFRALADIAQVNERSAVWHPNRHVGVPLALLANRWLRYYWPIVASPKFIPQSNAEGSGGKCMKFRAALLGLIDEYRDQGTHGGFTAWYLENQANTMRPQTILKQRKALKDIADTIVAGPVTYAGGALDSGPIFGYDPSSKHVLVPAAIWRELVLMGHWISEAVVLRWANLSAKFGAKNGVLGLANGCPEILWWITPFLFHCGAATTCGTCFKQTPR
ncbi:class I SAM-dependent methyltransferase [Limnobacter humi]|uniref:Class I SAM-dependent methyltransferase n=1 Tax=Limnobacter humi TaxID=1778671 RepID=A0ABT1WDX6_9BURK|nr:class I SAM-dependent methyltransferase [Limnobacter humi]MCQ8895726.1 class I SAM-dependent methyltransferase [Limnobacter humi]